MFCFRLFQLFQPLTTTTIECFIYLFWSESKSNYNNPCLVSLSLSPYLSFWLLVSDRLILIFFVRFVEPWIFFFKHHCNCCCCCCCVWERGREIWKKNSNHFRWNSFFFYFLFYKKKSFHHFKRTSIDDDDCV